MTEKTYSQRAENCINKNAQQLLRLLDHKKTNLALSADTTQSDELVYLADLIGPEICVLKTHIDIIDDFTPSLTKKLKELATKHNFMLFEDRKFADIGNTVKLQFEHGIYHIASWANIINAHSLPGAGVIMGLMEVGLKYNCGLLLIAEMSSKKHLMSAEYINETAALAKQYPDFVIGFITQHAIKEDQGWINITPGVRLESTGDALGQQYTTPECAILDRGNDIIIVGRGITADPAPLSAAQRYREAGWQAYLTRCDNK